MDEVRDLLVTLMKERWERANLYTKHTKHMKWTNRLSRTNRKIAEIGLKTVGEWDDDIKAPSYS